MNTDRDIAVVANLDAPMRNLGPLIREARDRKGLSLQKLAELLAVSRSAVNQWELGATFPETGRIPDLLRILEIDPMLVFPQADDKLVTSSAQKEDAQPRPEPATLPAKAEMALDVPLLGTAYGGDSGDFIMDTGDGGYVRRPPGAAGRHDVFALFVRGESMSPRYLPGELVYLEKRRAPQNGDHVVVELRPGPDGVQEAYLKRLVAITPTKVRMEQYNPLRQIEVDRRKVLQILRVMTLTDLMGV